MFLLSGRVNMAQYVFWGSDVIFAQNDNNSLRSLDNSPKTTEQGTKP
jgi:hypothetical protein